MMRTPPTKSQSGERSDHPNTPIAVAVSRQPSRKLSAKAARCQLSDVTVAVPLPRSYLDRMPTQSPIDRSLGELRRHLDHLTSLRDRIRSRADLDRDLSLHNDLLFSVLTIGQRIIDVATALAAQRGEKAPDESKAIASLSGDKRFPSRLVKELELLGDFRRAILRDYLDLDLSRVVVALNRLDPVEKFITIVRTISAK
jgi:uncharacterized protein YutE (UPF0331/DUF86 family)